MSTILVVDDIKAIREQFAYDINRKTNYDVLTAANGREALDLLSGEDVDVMVLDLEMPVMNGLEMLEIMASEGPKNLPVIVYTAKGDFQSCVRAVQLGAYNFFAKDEVSLEQLIQNIENALAHRQLKLENDALRHIAGHDSPLVGKSKAFKNMLESIRKVAQVPSNVLITGESGTGKELVAREIHHLSARATQPFIAVNCAAIPKDLVESELFGFEKGAFSGAIKTTRGKFEVAQGGTLFLDEIGDMPMAIQAKLLRVLQEHEITRLGGEGRVIKVDTRVIAATHNDLEKEFARQRFRQDLYYRICTHVIDIAPLRERVEDIAPLAIYFVTRTCKRFGIAEKTVHPDTLAILESYHWAKNNVRELENIVERMIIQCEGEEILTKHIPFDIRSTEPVSDTPSNKTFQELKQEAERQILLRHLETHEWHVTNTAKALGISNHSNLLKMMRRLNIKRTPDD